MGGKGMELICHICSHNFSLSVVFDCVTLRGHFSKEERKMQKCVSLQKKETGHCLCCAKLSVLEKGLIKKLHEKGGRILCRKD
jgi:hypothetical protein